MKKTNRKNIQKNRDITNNNKGKTENSCNNNNKEINRDNNSQKELKNNNNNNGDHFNNKFKKILKVKIIYL